ncbi:bifunctional diaminohydroxyphosphoribosylaminopyrimidine deaminase/5-amino-6-(5-phosphoribosylamino)uracil reductase RibD [Comamonadaceae bacterium OH2545_COT-014]|nr:bifunctional diaminohydroxyphosphoribosylaminopyrimidine deaminase/5-amino-6-(5-phosphoribosylamino)uracil reductase RibD [Comamonadaceae bacterium OH2545_COT-014]
MARALAQALQAGYDAAPNPRVGCVLATPDGHVIGEGHTQRVGGPHAEIMALRAAQAAGHATAGATAYVTLEPCAHHGRTGPCCDALAVAGIARVVAALPDPNPRVAGQGLARLAAAGVQVHVGPGAQEAFEINIGFFSRMVRGLPWLRLKVAASLDGTTALANGASQWITGEAARADGHAWRARSNAVLTGVGTVLQDDPRLDVRLADTARQPALVIVDSRLQTPLSARLWQVPHRAVHLYTADTDTRRHAPYLARGASVTALPSPAGKVDLPALLRDLAARHEVNELHAEAGHKLNGSLLREGLVDECLLYLAPRLLGPGAGLAAIGPFESLEQALPLAFHTIDRVGDDLRLIARPPGRAAFMP